MTACVDQRAHDVVLAAHDDHRHADEIEGKETAGRRDAALVAGANPLFEKDVLALALVKRLRRIAPIRQRLGDFNRATARFVVARIENVGRFRDDHAFRFASRGFVPVA